MSTDGVLRLSVLKEVWVLEPSSGHITQNSKVQLLRGAKHLGQEGGVCVFHIANLHVRSSNTARPLYYIRLSFTEHTQTI